MAKSGPIYVLGATSMPGWSLISNPGGEELIPCCNPHIKLPATAGWIRFNLEDERAYRTLFSRRRPKAIIHCGGVCDVEKCEADPAWARRVNVEGLEHLLAYAPEDAKLVYVSSDHVFGGRRRPYDEKSVPEPISIYGETRVEAERKILKFRKDALILRCSLGIGPSIDGRSGHLDWLRYRRRRGLPITIIREEFRSAVPAADLARRILAYANSGITGIRHITASRAASRVELADRLITRHRLGARFTVRSRKERPVPHLGRVELATAYRDALAAPLPSALD